MSVRNDSKRVNKELRRAVQADLLPPRVKVPWALACDLDLVTLRYNRIEDSNAFERVYTVPENGDITRVSDGIELSREGYLLAWAAAPRHVRRRYQDLKVG